MIPSKIKVDPGSIEKDSIGNNPIISETVKKNVKIRVMMNQ